MVFWQAECKEADTNVKLENLLYLLNKTLPLLRHIQQEQTVESGIEANIRGIIIVWDYRVEVFAR